MIKDLRISLSEAVFDAVYNSPVNNSVYPSGANLIVGAGHYTDDSAGSNLLSTNTIRFGYPLYNVHGTAELVVQDGGKGLSSYHFTIA